jgi:hypothetical protein
MAVMIAVAVIVFARLGLSETQSSRIVRVWAASSEIAER